MVSKILTRSDKPLSLRAQRFARYLFEGKTQLQAWQLAGYSTSYCEDFQKQNACRLANAVRVKSYLNQLHDKAAAPLINSATKRLRILSDIQNANVGDFVDENGNIKVNDLRSPAIAELKVERTYKGGIRRTLKLRDPVAAIDVHNKMERLYTAESNINVDVRQTFVFVMPDGTRVTPAEIAQNATQQS